jgi:alcohol dehydrogenase class IV
MTCMPQQLMLPPRTIARTGCITDLLDECAVFGSKGILVHGLSLKESGTLDDILTSTPSHVEMHTWQYPGNEPSLADVESLRIMAREVKAEWFAAVGGGSAIDAAKAAAGLLHAKGTVLDYHDGMEIPISRIPFIAAPTTAGTGSEATPVSVLTNTKRTVKKSIRHPSFIPRLVMLDPQLLRSCPRHVIASAGMDALTQAIESFTSNKATWFTDQLALRAISMISSTIEAAYAGNADDSQLEDLLQGSYLAGVALSNSRLGLVHGIAHPLGARYHQPHGLVCAACLLPVLILNREAIGKKYELMNNAVRSDITSLLEDLLEKLEITSPFKDEEVTDRDGIIKETLASGSTAANPHPVTARDVEDLLDELFV